MQVANHTAVKFINRVLSDYPMAREKLQPYSGKTAQVNIGAMAIVLRIAPDGNVEMVGSGTRFSGEKASESAPVNEFDVFHDVLFVVPLKLIPRLAGGDEAAFSEIKFSGDSEFASTLSTVARNVDWDVEEDLSKLVGDIAAYRVVNTAKSFGAWQADAKARLTANVAEYLTEEKRAFITTRELASFTSQNETLRDDVARLEARLKARMKERRI